MSITCKTCKTCKIDKEIQHFHFNSNHKRHLSSCRDCENKKRRERLMKKRGDKFEYTHSLNRQKRCSECGILKPLNKENFAKWGYYHPICRECSGIKKLQKERDRSNKLNKPRVAKHLVYRYRTTDKLKGLETNLSSSFLEEIYDKSCTYCGFPATGLDRIDNKIGHIESNCLPCCKECNHARNDNFTHEEMKIIGKAIKDVKLARINTLILN